jgi:hypothetical protein
MILHRWASRRLTHIDLEHDQRLSRLAGLRRRGHATRGPLSLPRPQSMASCVARKRSGIAPPPRTYCLAATFKIGPAQSAPATAPGRRGAAHTRGRAAKSGIVVTELSLVARTRARKRVELRGLEPLASCMPCASRQSIPIRHSRTGSLPPAPTLRHSRARSDEA